jgi:hypothetical protein
MCSISCVRRQAPLIDPARKTFLSPLLVDGKTRSSCCFRHPRFQKRKENPVKGLSDANRNDNLSQKRVKKIEKSAQDRRPQHQKNHARQERERERGRRWRRGTERLTWFKLGLNGGLVPTRNPIPELIPKQSINSGAGMSSVLLFSKSRQTFSDSRNDDRPYTYSLTYLLNLPLFTHVRVHMCEKGSWIYFLPLKFFLNFF